jgi:hypothetical protein
MKFPLFLLILLAPLHAGERGAPDFTRGGTIPENAPHDWNLGATGLRGWIHTHRFVTYDARQIAVTAVTEGSPAAEHFIVGDVILGVGGKRFSLDPRTEFGLALTRAESPRGKGELTVTRWRDGEVREVVVKLQVLGDYSATAPFDCGKSERILKQGCARLAADIAAGSKHDPIVRALNALALLASGDPSHLPLVKREAEWAASFTTDGYQTWYYGYVMMFAAEYAIATGDNSVLPGIRRMALEAARGQSAVGSWGHRFARPDGRLYGYGMMNSPGIPLTISLVLARAAGVDDPEISAAIGKSLALLRFYRGKGAVPYGDHPAWILTHEDNGKCGMAAVLFQLTGEKDTAEYFARMSLASHGSERDGGHTGNFFNLLWAMPGIALSGPEATGVWMRGFGGWYFDLARRHDGTFAHLGPPQPDHDSYRGWDATGAYLLALAMPKKAILLTGKRPSIVPQLNRLSAAEVHAAGDGWDDKNRNGHYDGLKEKELLARLSSWSPVVREHAATALSRRKDAPVAEMIRLLSSSRLDERYGACRALAMLRGRGAPAVDALAACLASDDLWLRVEAARALAAIGAPAMKTVPTLLELLVREDPAGDPRNMHQRYLSFALFDRRDGLLGRSLEGVDRAALQRAVRAGLRNQYGHARGTFVSVYDNLTYEELQPLLPAIVDAVKVPAPSGEMFADGIRLGGCALLSKHRVEEGMRLCVQYAREQNPWSSQNRTPEIMKLLVAYGSHAKPLIPELEALADYFAQDEPDFPKNLMKMKADSVREAIEAIRNSTEAPELRRIR